MLDRKPGEVERWRSPGHDPKRRYEIKNSTFVSKGRPGGFRLKPFLSKGSGRK